MNTSSLQEIHYLCGYCKRKRRVYIDREVHLNRHELGSNGLASYIDTHTSGEDKHDLHGVKIYVDHNFHVRTNDVINIEKKKSTGFALPIPTRKIKELNTRHKWNSWSRLELESKGNKLKFVLENRAESSENNTQITIESPLDTIVCKVTPASSPEENEILIANMVNWIQAFVKSMELASDLHVDLVPEVLRYIDLNCYSPLTKTEEDILAVLLDKSSVLIPYKPSMDIIINSKANLKVPGLDTNDIKRIAKKLKEYDKFTMADIQEILEDEILNYSELEEEIIVLAISQLIKLDAFDYRMSYVHEVGTITN